MREYNSADLRNVAVIGHGRTGKTTLVDACFYKSGAAKRFGKPSEKTSAFDVEPEEIRRGLSIVSSLAALEVQGCKLNLLDTPGYPDFIGEEAAAVSAADAALLVLTAAEGIEVGAGTEKGWQLAADMEKPRAFFINKMDREHADFAKVTAELKARFGSGAVPVQLPIGAAESFQGVTDIISLHSEFLTNNDKATVVEIPDSMQEQIKEARQSLIEALSDFNDTLMEKFLEDGDIPEEEVAQALAEGIAAGKVFPIFCGAAEKGIGVAHLLNSIATLFPPPGVTDCIGVKPGTEDLEERGLDGAFSARVFKTIVDPFVGRLTFMKICSGALSADSAVYNANRDATERIGAIFTMQGATQIKIPKAMAGDICVTAKLQATQTGDTLCDKSAPIVYEDLKLPESMLVMAAYPQTKGDEEKVFTALSKEREEDPTIGIIKAAETKETLVRVQGEMQFEILAERLARKFKANIEFRVPKAPLRETIRQTVKVEGKHKKQSGGHGQYGHVWLEISPKEAGSGNEFTETIFGGAVPRQYIPAVEKGTAETLAAGVIAGYPMVDVKVNLYDGSYHPVDSSEAAFKAATAIAIKKGVLDAKPVLLEPIYDVKIVAPEEFMGDIIGQLNARRAKIMGMDPAGKGLSQVNAKIPVVELYKYATALRAQTKGRGNFSASFSHYEEMPAREAEAIKAKYAETRAKGTN